MKTMINKLTQTLALATKAVVLVVGLGVALAQPAQAKLASEVFDLPYEPDHYCKLADGSTLEPDIPRGTANKQFIKDMICLHEQLAKFQADTQPTVVRYQASKAKAWLIYAAHEKSEGSITQSGRYALREALAIWHGLTTQQVDKLPLSSDILPTSGLQRADLWAALLAMKQTPAAFDLAYKDIANSEVKLIWGEAEYCEMGWIHAREHYSAAARWVRRAEVTALNQDKLELDNYLALRQRYLDAMLPIHNSEKTCQGAVLPPITTPAP